jgi:hypothetical protein
MILIKKKLYQKVSTNLQIQNLKKKKLNKKDNTEKEGEINNLLNILNKKLVLIYLRLVFY